MKIRGEQTPRSDFPSKSKKDDGVPLSIGMSKPSPEEVTRMLQEWSSGDRTALDKLIPLVYDELRRLAHHYMQRERASHTLQTTALVNEVYVRLIDQRNVGWKNRAHFFAISAKLMRRILVDYARSRASTKREGEAHKVSLDETAALSDGRDAEMIAIDDALKSLESIDPRISRVVELRFFGGLTIEEAAEVLETSHATIERDWNTARIWLYREINRRQRDGP
jgi:RNA polymerase sigma factor (TIGR02999 family)